MKNYPLPTPQMIETHRHVVTINNLVFAAESWQASMARLFKIFSEAADALNRFSDEVKKREDKGNKPE